MFSPLGEVYCKYFAFNPGKIVIIKVRCTYKNVPCEYESARNIVPNV